jgi:hypothetical protein
MDHAVFLLEVVEGLQGGDGHLPQIKQKLFVFVADVEAK